MKKFTFPLTLLLVTFTLNNETVEGIGKNLKDYSKVYYSEYQDNSNSEAMQNIAKYKKMLEQEKLRINESLIDTSFNVKVVSVKCSNETHLNIIQVGKLKKNILIIKKGTK